MPIGTVLRIQHYIKYPSGPSPYIDGPYGFGRTTSLDGGRTWGRYEPQIPNIVVGIDSIDAGLKCFTESNGRAASVEAGKTVISFVPNNSPDNSGMPLDMVCQLTSPLDAGKSVSVKTTLTITNNVCMSGGANLSSRFIRRVSATLPTGYMDESGGPAAFTDAANPMRPC